MFKRKKVGWTLLGITGSVCICLFLFGIFQKMFFQENKKEHIPEIHINNKAASEKSLVNKSFMMLDKDYTDPSLPYASFVYLKFTEESKGTVKGVWDEVFWYGYRFYKLSSSFTGSKKDSIVKLKSTYRPGSIPGHGYLGDSRQFVIGNEALKDGNQRFTITDERTAQTIMKYIEKDYDTFKKVHSS